MSDRGLPIVDGAPACPFVAFEDDRDGRSTAPDHRHRCFAETRPVPRALAHQEAYCLSSAFPVCPTFQDWARREAASARVAASAPDRTPREEPREEPPVSRPLPPVDLEPRHAPEPEPRYPSDPEARYAPDSERGYAPDPDVPVLPAAEPRRNPQRAWAAPPPWLDPDDEAAALGAAAAAASAAGSASAWSPPAADDLAEPPAFLAASERPVAAPPPEARGLAGSTADRIAGGDPDVPPVSRRRPAPQADDIDDDWPGAGAAAVGAAGTSSGAIPPRTPQRSVSSSRRPSTPPPPAGSDRSDRGKAKPDAAELFGPAWEQPRRYEAYPSLRTRIGIPSIGAIPKIGVAAIGLVLAGLLLFFIVPMLLVPGKDHGTAGASPTPRPTAAETATPEPTPVPDPTPQIYIVAKGDTMSKIASKFGVTVEQLLKANPQIKNANKIKLGDKITIPVPAVTDGSGGDGTVPDASTQP